MCELFGFCAAKSENLANPLRVFFSHSIQHPDGWGIATFHGGGVTVEKEMLRAIDSGYLQKRLSAPVTEPLLLAHIRKASVGALELGNCHPFVKYDGSGRRWTLIHNGTIFRGERLEQYAMVQYGSTDSERILLYIIEQMQRLERGLGRPATDSERFACLDDAIAAIAPGNKVNLIIYDGVQMYVHANMEASLYWLIRPEAVMVSTRPLSDEDWQPVPLSTLIALGSGRELLRGADRKHVYVEEGK